MVIDDVFVSNVNREIIGKLERVGRENHIHFSLLQVDKNISIR